MQNSGLTPFLPPEGVPLLAHLPELLPASMKPASRHAQLVNVRETARVLRTVGTHCPAPPTKTPFHLPPFRARNFSALNFESSRTARRRPPCQVRSSTVRYGHPMILFGVPVTPRGVEDFRYDRLE